MSNRKIINTKEAPKASGPYSQAIKIGNLLFVSGQIAIDPKSNQFIEGDIIEQSELVFKNIKAILEAGGSSLKNSIKVSIFLKDIQDYSLVNEIYAKYFVKDFPARICVEVSNLPNNAKIEVDIIAFS